MLVAVLASPSHPELSLRFARNERFCWFCAPICTFLRTRTAKSATFNSAMSFVFKYFLASAPLFSNKSFVFSYFLASFRQASLAFNNILASVVVFFVICRLPFPARTGTEPLSHGRSRARRPATTKCLQHDHYDRLSRAHRLVKQKMRVPTQLENSCTLDYPEGGDAS